MTERARAKGSGGIAFVLILLTSTFLMGSSFVAGKILLAGGFPPLLLVGWRFLLAALATFPLVWLEGRWAALWPCGATAANGAIVLLIGLLQTAAVMGLLFVAMRTISPATAAILLFTNPIWVALLGRFVLGEMLTALRTGGLVLGILGVALAIGPAKGGAASPAGEMLALLSSVCWASATVINKRFYLPLGPWALSFWQMLIGAVTLLVIAYASGQRWPATSLGQWGWLLWLAIPASTGSFGLWFLALRMGGATRTSGYLFLTPLFTVALAFFILDAPLSWWQVGGGAMIGIAVWLVNRAAPAATSRAAIAASIAEGEP
jgi:drug/metabolite transporter (DMT)-like permease